jgi:hypothetical protein
MEKTSRELISPQQRPVAPMYNKGKSVGSAGTAAATSDLSRMLDHIFRDTSLVQNLPPELQKGLKKIHKMTENIFKYASEDTESSEYDKEAFLGLNDIGAKLKSLGKMIEDVVTGFGHNVSEKAKSALLDAHSAVETEIQTIGSTSKQKKEEKAESKAEAKREKSISRYVEKQEQGNAQEAAVGRLKKMLSSSRHYFDLFTALPPAIKEELSKLSLDPENLKYLSSQKMVLASRSVVAKYLGTSGTTGAL